MIVNPTRVKIRPLKDHILVKDMEFGEIKTTSGVIVQSLDGKSAGIHPRWCQVYAVGPLQTDVKVDDWIYVEHGRWTRGLDIVDSNDQTITVRRVDNKAVLLQSDTLPSDVYLPA